MRFREVVISCLALGAMAIPALAEQGPVTVIGPAGPGLIAPVRHSAPSYKLIQIGTMHRYAVGLIAEDGVIQRDVVRLRMGNESVYIDPDRKYIRRTGGIDSGHSIMRAQRTHRSLTANKNAYVIRKAEVTPTKERAKIVPRAILIRPDYLERRDPQQPKESAPAPLQTEVEKGPVASAK